MPWCPDCRFEYVDGIQSCSDCGAALVDEEPTGKRPSRRDRQEPLYAPGFQPVPVAEGVPTELLMTVSTRTEADEIEAALVQNGVAVNRVFLGVKRITGIELHVAEGDLVRATDLLEQRGVLAPVDESFLEQFEQPQSPEQGEGEDDLEAYRRAVRELPKGHPDPLPVPEGTETALLATVSSTFEADRIEAVVRQERIPVWRHNRHAGTAIQAIWGGTNLGVDLLVPAQMLQAASEALERLGLLPEGDAPPPPAADPDKSPELLDDSAYKRGRSARGWVLLILFYGVTALCLLGVLALLARRLFGL